MLRASGWRWGQGTRGLAGQVAGFHWPLTGRLCLPTWALPLANSRGGPGPGLDSCLCELLGKGRGGAAVQAPTWGCPFRLPIVPRAAHVEDLGGPGSVHFSKLACGLQGPSLPGVGTVEQGDDTPPGRGGSHSCHPWEADGQGQAGRLVLASPKQPQPQPTSCRDGFLGPCRWVAPSVCTPGGGAWGCSREVQWTPGRARPLTCPWLIWTLGASRGC